ncbi:MAG: hypothetical protein LKE92_06665 [Atopobiaceae bacterium]|nr:hypothetical protein [Atopobiaceae bacterium]
MSVSRAGTVPKVKSTAPRMQTNKKLFAGIAIAAAVVVIAMIVIFNNALSSTTQTQTGEDAQTQQEEQQVGLERHDDIPRRVVWPHGAGGRLGACEA